MSGALPLAASIAAMSRDELDALVHARRVAAPNSVRDSLGLALELLRGDSLTRALHLLDRHGIATLQELASGGSAAGVDDTDSAARLRALGLLGLDRGETVVLAEVDAALRALLGAADRAGAAAETDPDASATAEPPATDEAAAPADTSGWYASALTSVRRAAALLVALVDHPTALGRRGTATAVSARELAHAVRSDSETVARLLEVIQSAGLAAPFAVRARYGREQRLLFPTQAVHGWLALPLHARWVRLAEAACRGISPVLREAITASSGDLARATREVLPHEYPLLPESERTGAELFETTADELGLATGGRLSPPAALLLSGAEADAVHEAAEQGFPAIVPGVYLQPDLSLIVPGPLSPEDEQALSAIADAEHWGVAVTLRLGQSSLQRAAQRGFGPDRIRELLARLSLTGIPQPLDYLLGDIERSARTLDPQATGRSRMAEPISEPTADADPPLDAGDSSTDDASPSDAACTDTDTAADALDALVDRVFEASRSEPGTGELSRKLELAIRDRSPVRVIAAAGGEERSFTLLPVSLAGGRLRATDAGAGVQRTLPLSAIVAVEAA